MNDVPPKPTLGQLAYVFARFGNLTFGGGSATVATLQREILDRRGWIAPTFWHLCYALSRFTPGTNLLAFCTAVGWRLRGVPGATIALAAGSIPCSLMAVGLTAAFDWWSREPVVIVALAGASAAVVAVMLNNGVTIVRPHFSSASWLQLVLFAGGAFVLSLATSVPPLYILLLAAVAGVLWPVGEKAHEPGSAVPAAAQGDGDDVQRSGVPAGAPGGSGHPYARAER